MSSLPLPTSWSVRSQLPEGTQLAEQLAVEFGASVPATSTFSVILVHGFNVTHDDARFSYAVFRRLVEAQTNFNPVSWIEFHWPGNKNLGAVSPASYPGELGPADQSGQVLADFIARQSPTQRFVVVAHSLGNRVLLGAIAALKITGAINRVLSICLMAPAVRVDKVGVGGFGLSRDDAFQSLVLYSGSDRVLQLAFPVGQTAARDGFFPQAVGHAGQPAEAWTSTVSCQGYGHGDYWTGAGKAKKPKIQYLPADTPLNRDLVASNLTEGNNFSIGQIAHHLNASTPLPLPVAALSAHEIGEHETPMRPTVSHLLANGTDVVG
jgi:esterase/lipase superfamily enzyme